MRTGVVGETQNVIIIIVKKENVALTILGKSVPNKAHDQLARRCSGGKYFASYSGSMQATVVNWQTYEACSRHSMRACTSDCKVER